MFCKLKLIVIVLVVWPFAIYGQSWNLPNDETNNRYFSNSEFSIERPGMTLQGFDSGNSYGLSVKDVLESVFVDNNLEKIDLYEEIIRRSQKKLSFNKSNNARNSFIIQSLLPQLLYKYLTR